MALLLVGVSSATAARTLVGEIDESEPGDALESPIGVAVDSTDHLWVTDGGINGGQAYKYNSSGGWEAKTNPRPWSNHQMLESIAFNQAAGKVFVSDSNVDSLWALNPATASYASLELKPIGLTTCCYLRVAADNSGGPYDGDLYVFSSSGYIVRIDSAGNPVDYTEGSSAGTNELNGADTPLGHFEGPTGLSHAGIAVDALGHIWVADSQGNNKNVVHKFAPSGKYLGTISKAGTPALQEVNAVAVDPTTGNVLVSEVVSQKIHEFTPAGGFVGTTSIVGGAVHGLAVDSTGKLYATVNFPSHKRVDIFGPAGSPAAKHALKIEVSGAGEVVGPSITCTQAGNGSAACEGEFVAGSEVPLEAVPSAGHGFAGWTVVEGNGGNCTSSVAACETGGLTAPTKLQATFVPTHSLNLSVVGSGTVTSAPAGIDCGSTCSAEFNQGASVVLTAVPGANSQSTVAWTGCNSFTVTTCTVSMSGAKSVTATFSLLKRSLGVTKSGTGTGTVSSSPPGINCGAVCSTELDHGTTVTLTAAPGSNTKAVVWSGCDSSTATTCTVAMSAARSVDARFDLVSHPLAVTKSGEGSGSVACNGTPCNANYEHGTKVVLTANADVGSAFAGFTGAGCSSSPCTVTIDDDTSVTATFDKVATRSAALRIKRVRLKTLPPLCTIGPTLRLEPPAVRCTKLSAAINGTIAKEAAGRVRVTISTRVDGKQLSKSKRVPVRNGHWRVRLALAGLDIHPGTVVSLSARFAGSPGVRGDHAKRRVTLER